MMENYEKDPSHIEHEIDPPNPFDAPQYFKIEVPKEKGARNIANKVLKEFGQGKPVVLYAGGRGISNAVSCAEIIKASHKRVHQITKTGQIRTIETWEPVAEGLDPLKVTRSVPMIYILLSLEPLDENENGYQKSMGRKRENKTMTVSELSSITMTEDCPTSPQSPLAPRKER